MVKPIVKDVFFLRQTSEEAIKQDQSVGRDLMDTLAANQDRCVGMAANMIGVKKQMIGVAMGFLPVVMINPEIISKSGEYEAGEIERYNIFEVTLLVRCAKDEKMYLYDITEIKKEAGKLFESEDCTQ